MQGGVVSTYSRFSKYKCTDGATPSLIKVFEEQGKLSDMFSRASGYLSSIYELTRVIVLCQFTQICNLELYVSEEARH